MSWGICTRIRNGAHCGNLARRMNGKTCNTCYAASWRERNLEKDTANRRAIYLKNKEYCKAQVRDYYYRHSEERKLYNAVYRFENREKIAAQVKARRAKKRAEREAEKANNQC